MIDDRNKEIYILGDLNCDMLKAEPDPGKEIRAKRIGLQVQ